MDRSDSPAELPQTGFACDDVTIWEQKRNHGEIESIARELEQPVSEIAELYVELYANLKSRAQVTDYLPVLVARKMRACYRTKSPPM